MTTKLSIIIPVYHEENNIRMVLTALMQTVRTPHVIYIVYDKKTDPTCQVVKKYVKKHIKSTIYLVQNSVGNKRGVINAIKTGIKKAKTEAILITMADLSDDVSQIDEMYSLIQKGYDVVCPSRYMKGGTKIGGPFFKSLLSRLAGMTLNLFFHLPTHDATNAFKMYRTSIFKQIVIESIGGFEYSLEITLKAFKMGYKIIEIPTVSKDREAGKSKFLLFHWLPKYIRTYLLIFGNKYEKRKTV